MKQVLMVVAVLFMATQSQAQGIELGLKAGMNFSNITNTDSDFSLDSRTGFVAGAFLGLKFTEKFGIQGELLYSQQGAEFDAGEFELNYVNVPVLAKFFLAQGLNLQVGPQMGFMVDDNVSTVFGDINDTEAEDIDFSGIVGLGYDFPLGIRVDARYGFGLTDTFSNSNGKNGVLSLALGYNFL